MAGACDLSSPRTISTELEVALVAPLGTPGVLDEPVLAAAFVSAFTIADDCDGVVNLHLVGVAALAVTFTHDTRVVATQAAEI